MTANFSRAHVDASLQVSDQEMVHMARYAKRRRRRSLHPADDAACPPLDI
jgi:hypothetical protein